MTKELEAFEDLKRQVGNMPYTSYDNGLGNRTTFLIKDSAIFPLIENALKRLETIECQDRFVDEVWKTTGLPNYSKEARENNKKLKALEIIKENLNIDEILLAVKGVCKASDYDLVKEVLL